MKSFSYTVKDELGIHARPAGMLVKEVKNFQSKVTLEKDGKSVDASRLMAVGQFSQPSSTVNRNV